MSYLIQELTEVLTSVEWAYMGDGTVACPWCKGKRVTGHYPDCPRQAVLARVEAEAVLERAG